MKQETEYVSPNDLDAVEVQDVTSITSTDILESSSLTEVGTADIVGSKSVEGYYQDMSSPTTANTANSNKQELTLDLRRQLCDQNLFIFHLPAQWNEEDLKREFTCFGTILIAKVAKKPDGTSKGYGFVCFTESSAACKAVENMNGKSFDRKRLKVSLKKTPEECLHLQVQKLMEISDANQPYDCDRDCTLFVFHVPAQWDDKNMYAQFNSFGKLVSARIAKRPDNNRSRGYGFVTYDNPRSAAVAIANMNGFEVGQNKRLKVQLKQKTVTKQPQHNRCTIFIFHLPSDWTEKNLTQHFDHYGKILGAIVQVDNRGNAKGYGFIRFERPESAVNAVRGMNGFSVGHKRLKVSLKQNDYSCCKHMPFINEQQTGTSYHYNNNIKNRLTYKYWGGGYITSRHPILPSTIYTRGAYPNSNYHNHQNSRRTTIIATPHRRRYGEVISGQQRYYRPIIPRVDYPKYPNTNYPQKVRSISLSIKT